MNIEKLKNKTSYTLEELRFLWDEFANICIDEDTEEIDESFFIWEKGTFKYGIWNWFDDQSPNGLVKDLMYGSDSDDL